MTRAMASLASLIVCVSLFAGCGASAPSAEGPQEPAAYENTTLPLVVATKPNGKLVRISASWTGVQQSGPDIRSDEFLAGVHDGSTIAWLAIPKAMAGSSAGFQSETKVTVEGRFEFQQPRQLALIRVHRIAAAGEE